MKLSINLGKPKPARPNPPPLRPSAFALADDAPDDEPPQKPTTHLAQSSKAMRDRIAAEKRVDETVYEYDEVWDKMQEAKERAKAAKDADAAVRKPKYIQSLLSSAATRKLDHLRAEEKMMQREREAEGDMYKDKESFVTQAYKDQMEEVRKAEEEEKKREEARRKGQLPSTGMARFYRQVLEDSAQQHQAAVAATEKRTIGPQAGPADSNPNLTITKPPELLPLSDADLARLARAEGKEVELNDDNQIVDKRELLSAGLNLSLPNTRHLGKANATQNANAAAAVISHQAVGTAASRREINERRTREIQQQLEEEKARAQKHREQEEANALQRTVAKRNNEDSIQDARSRYLERKRRKLEETAQQPPV